YAPAESRSGRDHTRRTADGAPGRDLRPGIPAHDPPLDTRRGPASLSLQRKGARQDRQGRPRQIPARRRDLTLVNTPNNYSPGIVYKGFHNFYRLSNGE